MSKGLLPDPPRDPTQFKKRGPNRWEKVPGKKKKKYQQATHGANRFSGETVCGFKDAKYTTDNPQEVDCGHCRRRLDAVPWDTRIAVLRKQL